MDRSTKFLSLAVAISIIVPIALAVFLFADGGDSVGLMIQALFLAALLPLIVMGAYMWATGKGSMLIAGYNTSPKAVRDQYDAEAMTKFTGMLLTISLVIMLAALETIFLFDSMAPFLVLLMASVVVLAVGLAYMNSGGRFLKEGVSPQDVKETTVQERKKSKRYKWGLVLGVVVTAVILIGIFLFMGYGSVNATLTDDSLRVEAPMMDESIQLDDVTSVEWRDSLDKGSRVGGFGGTEVSSGNFKNGEFGTYKLASYNSIPGHIVVHYSSGVLAFNLDSEEKTVQMYEDIQAALDWLSD